MKGNTSMETKLSIRLKALRKGVSLSASNVIERLQDNNLDYSEQSLYKWEQGAVTPSIKTLYALSKIYKCSISYLISNENLKFKKINDYEIAILRLYRTDFAFRNTVGQLMRYISKIKR